MGRAFKQVKPTIYLAAKFHARERMLVLAEALTSRGHTVVSSWLHEDSSESAAQHASQDLEDIAKADLFILDTKDESTTGGRDVEFGFATALEIPRWIVGPIRNIFHENADRHFQTEAELLTFLQEHFDNA